MSFQPYPLKFVPIVKDRIWGGTKLHSEYGKPLVSQTSGESWELSAVKGDVSQIANGAYAGKSLQELIDHYPVEVLGDRLEARFGKEFPLLFKFIDAREDLSIQVHPNDALARERHDSFGKTEMWVVLQADPGSRIIVGFKKDSNQEEFLAHVKDNTVVDLLGAVPAQAGQVFFLNTGTVHAIGAGVMIAEIQQTSDITYRIYDFDRKDANGNTRELHLDLALDAINYKVTDVEKTYAKETNEANTMVACPYFTTNFVPLAGSYIPENPLGSFAVYMCTEGSLEVEFPGGVETLHKGETLLIPSALREFSLHGQAKVLEVYID